MRTLFFAEALKKTQHEFNADRRLANDREGGKGKRRQLKMAITWRGSIALRGNLSSTKGRARRVDLQCPGDFFRARCPPGCLPPAPKLRTYDRGKPAGGTTPGAQGLCPWTPRFAWHAGHKNWGTGRAFWGHITELQMHSRHVWGIPEGHGWLVAYPRFFFSAFFFTSIVFPIGSWPSFSLRR